MGKVITDKDIANITDATELDAEVVATGELDDAASAVLESNVLNEEELEEFQTVDDTDDDADEGDENDADDADDEEGDENDADDDEDTAGEGQLLKYDNKELVKYGVFVSCVGTTFSVSLTRSGLLIRLVAFRFRSFS
jgi:hypothetical protein